MRKENKTLVELKNTFTGDIVICRDVMDISESNGMKFIRVFKEDHPERTFLVNREAFKILTK
jgi:hypothetical protein